MTEKQTLHSESAPQSDNVELISQEDLDMVNSASAAARRAMDVDTSSPTYAIPASGESQPDRAPRPRLRKPTKSELGWGAVGVASVVAGVSLLNGMAGGNDNPERGEVDQSIESVTLNPDANIRFDPYVDDEPNIAVPQLGAEVKIDAAHDIRVLEGTNNGTWYGIDIDDVAAKVPDAAQSNDKDGIVWVNEQGVESITTNDTPESQE